MMPEPGKGWRGEDLCRRMTLTIQRLGVVTICRLINASMNEAHWTLKENTAFWKGAQPEPLRCTTDQQLF